MKFSNLEETITSQIWFIIATIIRRTGFSGPIFGLVVISLASSMSGCSFFKASSGVVSVRDSSSDLTEMINLLDQSAPSHERIHLDTSYEMQNSKVAKQIEFFLGDNRPHLEKALDNIAKIGPGPIVELLRAGIPLSLMAVAIVESRYDPQARNGSGAAGLWQFMPNTAKSFGLSRSLFVDERLNPVLSSRAAAQLIRSLYGRFQDWSLTLASYNAGEGYVARQIKKGHSMDFWKLSGKGLICKQTREFVPKVLAVAVILERSEQYNVLLPGLMRVGLDIERKLVKQLVD